MRNLPFRYTDSRATLAYFDGHPCGGPGSNRKWSSIIEFVCDSEATFGDPELVSVDLDVCLIRFEWKTVSACVPDVIIQDENADFNEMLETCQYTRYSNDSSGESSLASPAVVRKISQLSIEKSVSFIG